MSKSPHASQHTQALGAGPCPRSATPVFSLAVLPSARAATSRRSPNFAFHTFGAPSTESSATSATSISQALLPFPLSPPPQADTDRSPTSCLTRYYPTAAQLFASADLGTEPFPPLTLRRQRRQQLILLSILLLYRCLLSHRERLNTDHCNPLHAYN